MRGAVGRGVDQRAPGREQARHRVHGGDLQGLLLGQRWEQRGQSLRQHGLARARRPLQVEVVSPGGGDLQGAPGLVLAGHVGHVEVGSLVVGQTPHARTGQHQPGHQRIRPTADRVGRLLRCRRPGQDGQQLAQAADSDHRHPGDERGLGRGLLGDHDPFVPGVGGGQHRRQHPPDRPHPAVQPQLADDQQVGDGGGVEPLGGGEHGAGHREVEAAAALGNRRGAEADRQLALRPGLAAVHDRGADPVAGLAERFVGQADQGERGHPGLQIGLDLDDHAVDADQRDGTGTGEGHLRPPPAGGRPGPHPAPG